MLWLTPYTTFKQSLLGAEINTFFAPPASMCTFALSYVVILPVLSRTYSAPADFQSTLLASRCEKRWINCPFHRSAEGLGLLGVGGSRPGWSDGHTDRSRA